MAIRKYTLDENEKLTEKQLQMIQEAAARPTAFDEDSPELTEEQLANFRRVYEQNQKERRRQNVTLRLKPQSVRKAKALGKETQGS